MIWSLEVHATSLTLTRICQTASPYLAWLQSRLIIFRIILLIPWSDIRHVMSLWIYHDNVESHDVLFYLMNDLCSRLDISLLQEVMSQRQICWWSMWHFRIQWCTKRSLEGWGRGGGDNGAQNYSSMWRYLLLDDNVQYIWISFRKVVKHMHRQPNNFIFNSSYDANHPPPSHDLRVGFSCGRSKTTTYDNSKSEHYLDPYVVRLLFTIFFLQDIFVLDPVSGARPWMGTFTKVSSQD